MASNAAALTILYRPVGEEGLEVIEKTGYRAFPPRLPEQPIFYPVTDEDYARRIARDWHTTSGRRRGYVTKFSVRNDFLARFDRQVVGGADARRILDTGRGAG